MNKGTFKALFLIFLTFIMAGCATTTDTENGKLSTSKRTRIYDATFEVVVKKPVQDNLVYEKELPWDLIPFNIRNDEYYSIGTAFAVSETELFSAFHVLSLNDNSEVYTDYYIRDKNSNVYEIDMITGFNESKDYIRFTVKDLTFDTWFDLSTEYTINEPVFSAGNAYGEGIIIREGNLIGTMPEQENGEWVYLRSSSDVNSGNSGGPLINSKGEVIAIVCMKKDNIAYSLPLNEVLNEEGHPGKFYEKQRYGFGLVPERSDSIIFNETVKLPRHYKEVRVVSGEKRLAFYSKNMDSFFKENEAEMFPRGTASLEALYDNTSSILPQVVYKAKDDKKWYISGLDRKSSTIRDNGMLYYSSAGDSVVLFYLEKPDSVTLEEVNSNPRLMMDLFLEGLNFPRIVAGERIRINSLGEPVKTEVVTDSYGRKWNSSRWLIDYSDEYILTFTLPTPEGNITLFKASSSGHIEEWAYDLRKMLDFMEVSYYGEYSEWQDFLAMGELIPANFKSVDIALEGNKVKIDAGHMGFTSHGGIIEGDEETLISLDFDIYPRGEDVVWDVRSLSLSEKSSENYMVLYKSLKPSELMRKKYHEEWQNVIKTSHPFNGIPYNEDGLTNLGRYINYEKGEEAPGEVYSLFIAKEGRVDDSEIYSVFNNVDIRLK